MISVTRSAPHPQTLGQWTYTNALRNFTRDDHYDTDNKRQQSEIVCAHVEHDRANTTFGRLVHS